MSTLEASPSTWTTCSDLPTGEFEVQDRPRADAEHDAGLHHLLEAGLLGRNIVSANLHFCESVASLPVGSAGIGDAGVDVLRLDLGVDYDRAAGIRDGSGKRCFLHLRM